MQNEFEGILTLFNQSKWFSNMKGQKFNMVKIL